MLGRGQTIKHCGSSILNLLYNKCLNFPTIQSLAASSIFCCNKTAKHVANVSQRSFESLIRKFQHWALKPNFIIKMWCSNAIRCDFKFNKTIFQGIILTLSSRRSTLNNFPSPFELLHVRIWDLFVTLALIIQLKQQNKESVSFISSRTIVRPWPNDQTLFLKHLRFVCQAKRCHAWSLEKNCCQTLFLFFWSF